MNRLLTFDNPQTAAQIAAGGVGIIPTDTLYGMVASALQPQAVQRVYELKGRASSKPCIILIDRPERALEFGVPATELAMVRQYWPGALSVIFSTIDPRFAYLRRSLGVPPFRVPDRADLRDFLARSGPIIAPSANQEGETPVATIKEAQAAFGDSVDVYIDGGKLQGEPSTIVKVHADHNLEIIRQGSLHL
ncbi:MAG TPA: L-threonylcarbamoyladenylate synthase [Candidatus Saccharimonadales bacterium]|nr:L-threonylcarbamoyladenylate synthase [Candidatus Saccharimonadales bacterium]